MVGPGRFRCEQQKHQIDRLAVERLEIDGPFEPRKQTEQLIELGQLTVRNRDAVAHAGRTELLALLQRLQNGPLGLAAELGSLRGQLLQDLLLAVDLQCRNDGIGRDKIGEEHGPFRRWGAQPGSASQRRRTISTPRWAVNGHPSRSAVGGARVRDLDVAAPPGDPCVAVCNGATAFRCAWPPDRRWRKRLPRARQPRAQCRSRDGPRTRCESRSRPCLWSRVRKTRRRSIWPSLPRDAY